MQSPQQESGGRDFSPAASAARSARVVKEIYNYNRLPGEHLPEESAEKMRKMSESPFAFFRGTAHIFYRDMVALPRSNFVNQATSRARLMGDAHPGNLGAFRDAAGNFVFDVNDFDEGYIGPYIWDPRRMATGLMLAAKANGLDDLDQADIAGEFANRYLDKLEDFKGNKDEKDYRLTKDNTSGYVRDLIDASRAKSRGEFLDKYTIRDSETRVFQTTDKLRALAPEVREAIAAAIPEYRNTIAPGKRESETFYEIKDMCMRLGSGIGSLGFRRYYVLIAGPSSSPDDYRILEMKERIASALALAAPSAWPAAAYDNHEGKRVAITMKAMLTNTDKLAGHANVDGRQFFVREKSPHAVDLDVSKLKSKGKFETAAKYLARALAGAHARSDKDYNTEIARGLDKEIVNITSGKRREFREELVNFARDYARRVQRDYASFKSAYESGVPLF